MSEPRKPTPEECSQCTLIFEDEYERHFAIWYPQMGGYVGRAVVVLPKTWQKDRESPCFEAYVWHDGDFPFHDDEDPCELHHCNAEQFIEFGQDVLKLCGKQPQETRGEYSEMKPCPFCGSDPTERYIDDEHMIYCPKEDCLRGTYVSSIDRKESRKLWNRQVEKQSQDASKEQG